MPARSIGAGGAFWPAAPEDVAVVAAGERIGVTDGDTTIDLGLLPGVSDGPVAGAAEGDLIALIAGSPEPVLAVIDLTSGEVVRTTCGGCDGVAVLGTHVVSLSHEDLSPPLAPDGSCTTPDCAAVGSSYALVLYDATLAHETKVPITPIAPPPSGFSEDHVYARIDGTADNRLIISSMWSSDVRRGPTIFSLYTLEGALDRSWTVDGKVYQSTTSADGGRIALDVGGSSGACSTVAMPVVIATTQPNPVVLGPLEHTSKTSYFTTDVWWNGSEVVTSGVHLDSAGPGPCVTGRDVRRFDVGGQLDVVETPHVVQYRLLGPTCDRAVLVKTAGPERPEGFPSQVYAIHGGKSDKIRGYDTLLWSAPRTRTCTNLPGL